MSITGAAQPLPTLPDLITSANDTAANARTVVGAMLATAIPLAATILASTDEAIFRNSLDAPFGMGVSIKLSIAYALMPAVFLFLHATALLQLHVLAVRLHAVDSYLKSAYKLPEERDHWRRQLSDFFYVQYYVDEQTRKDGVDLLLEYVRNGLLWVVVQVAVAWAPLAILLGTQISFLRYQSDAITASHMIAIIIDVALLVWFTISQAKLLKAPSERPGAWLLILALICICTWLLGLPVSYALTFIGGMAIGWITITVVRLLTGTKVSTWRKVRRAVWICAALLVFVDLVSELRVSWCWALLIGMALAVEFAAAQEKIEHYDWSHIRRHKKLQRLSFLEGVLGPIIFAAPVLLISLAEATVPDGTEPACQIRWQSPPTAPAASLADERRQYIGLVVLPVLGRDRQTPCILSALPPKPHSTATTFILDGKTSITRANIFDRWLCPEWQIGCRFLDISSLVISAVSRPAQTAEASTLPVGKFEGEAGPIATNRGLRYLLAKDSYLVGTDFRWADLRGSELSGGSFDISNFYSADLRSSTLKNADLRGSSLADTRLSRADFTYADLSGASLDSAVAEKTIFNSADIGRASLSNILAPKAIFSNASLRGANLEGASLPLAVLDNTAFDGSFLKNANFLNATVDGNTTFRNSFFIGTSLQGMHFKLTDFSGSIFVTNLEASADSKPTPPNMMGSSSESMKCGNVSRFGNVIAGDWTEQAKVTAIQLLTTHDGAAAISMATMEEITNSVGRQSANTKRLCSALTVANPSKTYRQWRFPEAESSFAAATCRNADTAFGILRGIRNVLHQTTLEPRARDILLGAGETILSSIEKKTACDNVTALPSSEIAALEDAINWYKAISIKSILRAAN